MSEFFMKCYPLARRDYALLAVFFIIGYIFTELQPSIIPAALRPFTYLLAVIVLMLAFFFMVRPEEPVDCAKYVSLLLGAIVAVVIVIEDVIIRKNVPYTVAVVWLGAIIGPLAAGYIYLLVTKKKT
jgi:peptidoglycan/LPS O-acetylase OafA/YrhL